MPVTERTKKQVWAISAGRCAICRELLVEALTESGDTSLVGDIAHIVAEQEFGPRGKSSMGPAERNSADNLLLLCLRHHRLVDDHVDRFTVEELIRVRADHIRWVNERLSAGPRWISNVHNLFYVNVPRLGMLAQRLGEPIHDQDFTDLRALGGGMLRFLQTYQPTIERLHPNAVPLDQLPIEPESIGSICAFSQRFRTKNVGKALDRAWTGFNGNLSKDPHVYTDCAGYKLVLPVDPRWLTTSTAGVHLSSGQGEFAGLCFINSIDEEKKQILGSLLLLGHPKNALMDALFG